jgi:hypothetical protein
VILGVASWEPPWSVTKPCSVRRTYLEDGVCVVSTYDGQHLQLLTFLRPQRLQAHHTYLHFVILPAAQGRRHSPAEILCGTTYSQHIVQAHAQQQVLFDAMPYEPSLARALVAHERAVRRGPNPVK